MTLIIKGSKLAAVCCALLAIGAASYAASQIMPVALFPDNAGGAYEAQYYDVGSGMWGNLDDAGSYYWNTAANSDFVYLPLAQKLGSRVQMYSTYQDVTIGTRWAAISYLVPTDGLYSWNVQFSDGFGGCTTIARIINTHGGVDTELASAPVRIDQSPIFSNEGISLNAGDYIRFAVDPDGNMAADTTWISDLGPLGVPEPASLAALITGLAGFAALRRSKR